MINIKVKHKKMGVLKVPEKVMELIKKDTETLCKIALKNDPFLIEDDVSEKITIILKYHLIMNNYNCDVTLEDIGND